MSVLYPRGSGRPNPPRAVPSPELNDLTPSDLTLNNLVLTAPPDEKLLAKRRRREQAEQIQYFDRVRASAGLKAP